MIETERRRRARVIAAVLGGWSAAEDRAALTDLLGRFRDDYQSYEDHGENS